MLDWAGIAPVDILTSLTELPPEESAPCLLGCRLSLGDMRALIVEVEAYSGTDDPASHGFRGRTKRNATMFGPPGRAYIYFNYGCHWMLNVSVCPDGVPGAVLVRAAVPEQGLDSMRARRPGAKSDRGLLSGPGKLCQALGIDRSLEGEDLFDPQSAFRIEPCQTVEFLQTRRIGLREGKGDEKEWRFVSARHLEWLSRPVRAV